MISKISSRVGATRIFVVRPGGFGITATPTPTFTSTPTPTTTSTPTATPTSTPTLTITPTPTATSVPTPTPTPFIPDNDFTYVIIPNNDLSYTLIPSNDLVYLLIPNDDLTYTLIPTNDLTHTLIPGNDLLYTLVPDGDLTYVLLPDNDLNPIEIPINDINYTLIPNTDLTYTLIPNNDLEYSVLRPPTVFYGEIILGEDSVEGTCNCAECPRFYVTGDGSTFCESNIFVITGGGTFFSGWGTIVHNGYYKTVNMDGSNVATYRTDCGTCPTPEPTPTSEPTPTPTETPTPTSTSTPTPTPTQVCDTFTFNNVNATTTYNSATGGPDGGWTSSAYSTETYSNPVSVTFQTSSNGNYLMGGFSTNPTSYEDTYQNIRYGLYVQNGFLEIYENGGQATVPGSMENLSTDIWKVEYDGTNVKYYKNSSLIHTSSNPVTQPLHIFFALLTPNEGVTNVCVIGTPDTSCDITYNIVPFDMTCDITYNII